MENERRTGNERRQKSVTDRLDEIEFGYKRRAAENRALIRKFAHRATVILSALAIIQLALGLLSVHLVVRSAHQQHNLGQQQRAIRLAIHAIQEQRAEATWDGCRTQNYHHDLTVRRLGILVRAIKDPAQKSRAQNNTAATVSLIDALDPVQNCKLLLAERLHVTGTVLNMMTRQLQVELGPARPPHHP